MNISINTLKDYSSSGISTIKTGRGNHYSATVRQLIVHHTIYLDSSVDDIISAVFVGQQPYRKHFLDVMHKLRQMNRDGIEMYIMGPSIRGGNDRKLSLEQAQRIAVLRKEHTTARLEDITTIFNNETYDIPELEGVSKYVISRTIKEAHISKKNYINTHGSRSGGTDGMAGRYGSS